MRNLYFIKNLLIPMLISILIFSFLKTKPAYVYTCDETRQHKLSLVLFSVKENLLKEEIRKQKQQEQDAFDFLASQSREILVPKGLGKVHTYMGWQMITTPGSRQKRLIDEFGMNFDENGFAKIGVGYVIACTTTFGKVGDIVRVVKTSGEEIVCIIGDIKSQKDIGCNKWGHQNGACVIEFIVDKESWYYTNKTVDEFHPEWKGNIEKIINYNHSVL